MKATDHMMLALGQMEMADCAIVPGQFSDQTSANLHTSMVYLQAAIQASETPITQLEEADAAIAK